jgi:hypothetical protein
MDLLSFIQKELPKIFRRYFIVLAGASLIAALSTYFITSADPSIHQAKTRLLIGPNVTRSTPTLMTFALAAVLYKLMRSSLKLIPYYKMPAIN